MLKINDLVVKVDGQNVIDSLCLSVNSGETHALMGPNGSGKSSLCLALMGHPRFKVISGEIEFEGKDLLELSTDERARLGLFLGFQYPREVSGITFGNFLRQAANLRLVEAQKPHGAAEYFKIAAKLMEEVGLEKSFIGRGVNEGFSGGEKKRAEIAQMIALKPKLAVLDEIDSGLDIDALKVTASAIEKVKADTGMGLLLITHYQRLLHHLPVDFVHVMVKGKVVASGGPEMVETLEKEGYKSFL
jgi:Fe-S cluster assembly ATP-binding protein